MGAEPDRAEWALDGARRMIVQAGERYGRIEAAIADQRCVLLDGGVATELEHSHGQDDELLWGMETLASAPDKVGAIHRAYAAAGAEIITTNTWALPTVMTRDEELASTTLPVHWMEVARRGVHVAREAIAAERREDDCLVGFSVNGDLDTVDGPEFVTLLWRALASAPPDLILFETLSVLRPSLFTVIEALLDTGLPLWLSFRRCQHGLCGVYGQHWGGPEGDAFGRAARRFEEMGVAALLVNCIPPDHVDGMVSYLRDFTDLTLGVYPNLGYYTNAGWRFETGITGDKYGELALRWRAEGAQIVGGCCGTRPEHITAAKEALEGTSPGRERRQARSVEPGLPSARHGPAAWRDGRGQPLYPVPFPRLRRHAGVAEPIPGSYLMWRHLVQERLGAYQRCLDIGSGTGLQTIQLALNGASHVHAIDIDDRAVSSTLDNAFRNGVSDRVSAQVTDLFPWIPEERYELIVANLPQLPVDPLSQLSSHRPIDFWGRGLIDQVIGKLPHGLAGEGVALLTLTSLISRDWISEALDAQGLRSQIVAWELQDLPTGYREHPEHLARIIASSDGYLAEVDDLQALVCYIVEIRRWDDPGTEGPPWSDPR